MVESSMKLPQFVIDALADLRKRTTFLPLPQPGFNPLKASAEELRYFGFPVPDDYPPGSPGNIARLKFLTGPERDTPVKFVRAVSDEAAYPEYLATVSLVVPGHPWPTGGSNNWSGGYVTPRGGDNLTLVEANWTVPAVAAPTGGVDPEYYCSTWIGLDGQRSYRDSTLPQTGTMQVFTGATGVTTYSAWYQWWAKGPPMPWHPLALPVAAGDEVYASLTVLNPTTVRFNIKNVTLGVVLGAFDVATPTAALVSGATAEWIMERPTPLQGGDSWTPYPLPAYQDFSFTGCRAESTAPDGSAPKNIDLELARLIRMNEITKAPPGVRTISVAKKTLLPSQHLDLRYTGP
jgi:hypothetical protein